MINRAVAGTISMFVLIENGLANHHMTSEHAEPLPGRTRRSVKPQSPYGARQKRAGLTDRRGLAKWPASLRTQSRANCRAL